MRNLHFASEPPQFDWTITIVKCVLVSAAPAVVIGCRIGTIEPAAKKIWWSRIIGVCLPLIFPVTAASLAAEAGMNLHWFQVFPGGSIGLYSDQMASPGWGH